MSDDKDKKPPELGEERTVFMPGGPPATPPPPAPPTAGTPAEPTARTQNFAPRADAVGIKVGDMLNHIFEVKRFLARGGMGEVFEGCNVHTDERVAIKVMLPALAGDEKVIAMFRKEAKTLTKLHHQALVEYRVLAQEPDLHVLYIVTDYIEGTNLSASLGTLKPTPEQLAALLRRLAGGLAAAHELGAVHRDISPDNVILEREDIDQAKIIDFGIAKDLEASGATIVGDGFAGKLNYVAPEQLGDYDREIGPWSDVYSLGLVILAVASGKNVDMSGSLVDAIDKRRRGPDLSPIPDDLRPLLAAMLRPDPKERLRSMEQVMAMLDGAHIPSPETARESLPVDPGGSAKPSRKGPMLALLALLLALALALVAAWYFGKVPGLGGEVAQPGNGAAPAPPANPIEAARGAIDSVLPSVSCTWLDIGRIEIEGGRVAVALRGVAGDADVAADQLRSALIQAGLQNPTLNFGDVAPIRQAGCAVLDALRQIRAPQGGHLSSPRARYEMSLQQDGAYAGREASNPVLDLEPGAAGQDIALIGIEPSGQITLLLGSRARFEQALAQSVGGRPVSREGNGRFRIHVDSDHDGWSGFALISGRGPFDPSLLVPDIGARGPEWRDRLIAAAGRGSWSAEMVWYESVNREAEPAGDDSKD
jgi:eukaryotic-like serine/threonine-protein kinase